MKVDIWIEINSMKVQNICADLYYIKNVFCVIDVVSLFPK